MFVDVIQSVRQGRVTLPFILDALSCIGVVAGLIASLQNQQVMVAIIALSVMFVVQVMHRSRQSLKLMDVDQTYDHAIERLNHSLQELDHVLQSQNVGQLKRMIEANDHAQQEETDKLSAEIRTRIKDLEVTVQKLHSIVAERPVDGRLSAQDYYKQGMNQEQLGRWDAAIADYTRALDQRANHPFALLRRGFLYLKLNKKQAALADLNAAAQKFFSEGDLTHYELAKEKAEAIEFKHQETRKIPRVKVKSDGPASVSSVFGLG